MLFFGVRFDWDTSVIDKTSAEVIDALRDGEPSIWVGRGDWDDPKMPAIQATVTHLSEGEEAVVGERIAAVLRG